MSEKTRGTMEMVAAMMVSGTIGWFVVVSGSPIPQVVFWRCVFGALVLLPVCAAKGYLQPSRISRRQAMLAVLGGIAIVANWLLLFAAYSQATISIATTVYNTQPFMLVGLGALFLGERLTLAKLGWLLLSFGGMLLIVQSRPDAQAAQGSYLLGILLALGAAFFYALAALLAKKLKDVPPHLIALIQVGLGVLMLAPFVHFDALPASGAQWLKLATLGIVNTGVMYVLLYGAIQKLPTAMTGALSFVYPVVAIGVDRVAFGQKLAWVQVVGAVLILLAAAGVNLGWRIVPQRRYSAS